MRGSRAILYAERVSELTSQLSELEDLRDLVEEAERSARGVPPLRLTLPPSRPFDVVNGALCLFASVATRH